MFTHNAKLQLIGLAQGMPSIWRQLERKGFLLSSIFIQQLCSLAPTDPKLQHPEFYYTEMLREIFSLPNTRWIACARDNLRITRSEYLDYLTSRIASGGWPSIETHATQKYAHLDPSYIRSGRLTVNEPSLVHIMNTEIASRKKWEIEMLADSSAFIDLAKHKVRGQKYFIKLMNAVFGVYGFSPCFDADNLVKQKRESALIYVSLPTKSELRIVCEFRDSYQARKSLWPLRVGFLPAHIIVPAELSLQNTPVIVGIDDLLPGGWSYLKHNQTPGGILLGCLVTAELLALVRRFLDSSIDSAS